VQIFQTKASRYSLWICTAFIGLTARISIALLGHNGDFDFWIRHAEVLRSGGNLYLGGESYGYGPIWMIVLRTADVVQSFFPENRQIFRLVIIIVLSGADFFIARLIARDFSFIAGIVFFLNPVSIIISGYHNQFDNLALSFGLFATLKIARGTESTPNYNNRKFFIGLLLLGLSLSTKQILILFPVFLLFQLQGTRQRFLAIAVPYLVFALSFLPWMTSPERIETLIREVFAPRGRSGLLLTLIGADYAGVISDSNLGEVARSISTVLFIFVMILFGWIMRKRPLIHSLIIYLVLMVAVSPAYSQQQLILPLVAVFVYATIELKVFYLLTLLFMIQNSDELGIEFFFPHFFRLNGTIYAWLQVLLIIFSLRLVAPKYFPIPKSKHFREALREV